MSDLLPCPFCGGIAAIKSGGPGCHYVSCTECAAASDDGSVERATELWNSRAERVGGAESWKSQYGGLVVHFDRQCDEITALRAQVAALTAENRTLRNYGITADERIEAFTARERLSGIRDEGAIKETTRLRDKVAALTARGDMVERISRMDIEGLTPGACEDVIAGIIRDCIAICAP